VYYRRHGAFEGSGTGAGYAKVLGPLDVTIAAKLAKHHMGKSTRIGKKKQPAPEPSNIDRATFKVDKELLYDGQGKINPIVDIISNKVHAGCGPDASLDGLQARNIEETEEAVTGNMQKTMRWDNKRWRQNLKSEQPNATQWSTHEAKVANLEPTVSPQLTTYRNSMCPTGHALHYPAVELLNQWATFGCPTNTGNPWSKEEMWTAVARGPHQSALAAAALEHFAAEATEKVRTNQARIVAWDDIKDDPPLQLKISPIAAIPHKSKAYRSIFDLSFCLRLENGGVRAAVNNTTTKTVPKGAMDQVGECLSRIIHVFAEADPTANLFMTKWDIKDGFWRMDCAEGEEWNFAYVLPQLEGEPIKLVVPTSLQMGWVKSPPYFCAATETARDVTTEYIKQPVGTLQPHKFDKYVVGDPEFDALLESGDTANGFLYTVEVYVDDFMSLVIPISRKQLRHVATAVMTGIHDVFPPDNDDSNDPILEKKLRQQEGQFSTRKTLLGFDFDGIAKTMWLEDAKREKLLTALKGWIRAGERGMAGIPLNEFKSVTAKLQHAFTCIPDGVGLLSPCNKILQLKPRTVYLHRNKPVLNAKKGCRTLLRESTREPMRCRELTCGWPDYIGIVDASSHSVGGVMVGELSGCVPTVFQWQWPEDIRTQVISFDNPAGNITNLDLEIAGLLILWLVIKGICGLLTEKRIALFGDNSPLIS
jgi:hypothetical protein